MQALGVQLVYVSEGLSVRAPAAGHQRACRLRRQPSAEKKSPSGPPPAQLVDVNSASAAELQQLPGVGPATARVIIHHRSRNGPFRRVEELLIIRGISRTKLRRLRPYVRLK